ncbi:hypothetical protein Pfo_016372 [Paulownia fortunei]|nr:hypothetical protein Pfo_016372 [Paulownia fortunei]
MSSESEKACWFPKFLLMWRKATRRNYILILVFEELASLVILLKFIFTMKLKRGGMFTEKHRLLISLGCNLVER